MSKELIERAKQDMTDARVDKKWSQFLRGQGSTGGDNVITGCIFDSGSSTVRAYPCHRPINSFSNAKIMWSAFGYRNDPEIARFYFDWLLDRSPWSKTGIVPKLDREFMFETGFVFPDLDKISSNLLHNFLIASRLSAEWPNYIKDWYKLVVGHGINSDLAFFFMTMFCNPTQGVGGYESFLSSDNISYSNADKYDWPLDTFRANEEYLRNFLSGKTPGLSSKMFYPSASTAPVNTLWGSVTGTGYYNVLQKLYPLHKNKSVKSTYGYVNYECLTLDNVLTIIKQEEVRLGLKKERLVA